MNGTGDTMNCENYIEAISADPSESFDGGAAHAAGCADCRDARDAVRALDSRVYNALAIPVPEMKMPALDAGDTVVSLPLRQRMTTPAWFAVAAGFALAAVIGLQIMKPDYSQMTLAEQVVAHLDHEEGSLVVTDVAVSERTLESVVSSDVARMDDGVGLVTYARSCVINGRSVPHLVIQGEKGPVTLLLMPDEYVTEATPLAGESINGVILPVGNGSIAIIGERDEQIRKIGDRVAESVSWTT